MTLKELPQYLKEILFNAFAVDEVPKVLEDVEGNDCDCKHDDCLCGQNKYMENGK